MKIPVETYFDKETDQWCVSMVAPPWIASCGRALEEAKVKTRPRLRDAHIELVRVT